VIVALDTNVLAYAEGVNGAAMRARALDLVEKLPTGAALLPVQTLRIGIIGRPRTGRPFGRN
jgi:predicted nucleic acid-binding protein